MWIEMRPTPTSEEGRTAQGFLSISQRERSASGDIFVHAKCDPSKHTPPYGVRSEAGLGP